MEYTEILPNPDNPQYSIIKTIHINDNPTSGYVKCPACHSFVHLDDESCLNCGESTRYAENVDIIRNWNLNLIRNRVEPWYHHSPDFISFNRRGKTYRTNFYNLKTGKTILQSRFESSSPQYCDCGAFIVKEFINGKTNFGLYTKHGVLILDPVCEHIRYSYYKDYFIIKYKGKTGINNLANQNLIPYEYDSIYYVCENLVVAEKEGKWGGVDWKNHIIIPFDFDKIGTVCVGDTSNLYPVYKNQKWGYYNTFTQLIAIPNKYDKADGFRDGCAKVSIGGLELFIDTEGYPTLPKGYGEHRELEWGRVVLKDWEGHNIKKDIFNPDLKYITYKVNGKKGLITPEGVFKLKAEYDELLYDIKSNLCSAQRGGKYGVISPEGEIILPFSYLHTTISDGLIRIRRSEETIKTGYVNKFGETIIPFHWKYHDIFGLGCGLFFYDAGDCAGVIDKFGNYVEYKLDENDA